MELLRAERRLTLWYLELFGGKKLDFKLPLDTLRYLGSVAFRYR